jgi:hypothetical protein
MRSASMATDAETIMAAINMTMIESSGLLSRKPLLASASATKNAPKVPNMKNSPWAKLIMPRMPYTIV